MTWRQVRGLAGVSAIVLGLLTVHVSMITTGGRYDLGAGMPDATLFGLLLYLWYWASNADVPTVHYCQHCLARIN